MADIAQIDRHVMSEAEFFDWLVDQDRGFALVDGQPMMLTGC